MKSFLIAFNFALFAAAMYLLLGPAISGFFYGRAEALKHRMAEAGSAMRRAEQFLANVIKKKESLPGEIEQRKKTLEESARIECEQILSEASNHSNYIMESARRAGLGELAKNKRELSGELLEEAFAKAMQEIQDELKNSATAKSVIDKGVRGLSGFSDRG